VYASLKQLYPGMSVFPSFSLETMMQAQNGQACQATNWNAKQAPAALIKCAKDGYAALAGIPRDAFAWSSFPALPSSQYGGFQPWYLSVPLAQLSAVEKGSMIVANTGFTSTTLALNFANSSGYEPPLQCVDFINSNISVAASWFETVVAASSAPGFRAFVINFKAARDTLFDSAMKCPCSAPLPVLQPYCDMLIAYRGACFAADILPAACEVAIKISGSLGVRDIFGAPREPLFSALQEERKQPLF